jgi:hypothetical protein
MKFVFLFIRDMFVLILYIKLCIVSVVPIGIYLFVYLTRRIDNVGAWRNKDREDLKSWVGFK